MAGRSGKRRFITHTFAGGWATDFGPQFYGGPNQNGMMELPFLVDAKNCIYELDGGPHKCPGAAKLNSSVISSATTHIRGVFDYWRQGASGSPAQQRMVYAGTEIYSDNAAGTFTVRKTGLESGKVPCFTTFNDLLVISTSSTTDVPMSWDQTTFQNLAGTPPRFSFSIAHRNFMWAAGVYANPSRLYYSVVNNPEDWTSAGSGSIDIDLGDGDMITGLASYKNQLWVFKGPYKNSIHVIDGSAPTGSDAFSRTVFVRGVSAIWHNGIFQFGDDLGFVSTVGNVHSLKTTASYANYNVGTLTFPITSWIMRYVTQTSLKSVSTAHDANNGRVYISLPINGSTTNNAVLMMDYRFGVNPPQQYPRWALWDSFSWASIAMVIDTSTSRNAILMAGGYVGYVYKASQQSSTNDGTSINYQITLPYLTYGDEFNLKTLEAISIGMAPKNTNNISITWTEDATVVQSTTIAQAGGDTLG